MKLSKQPTTIVVQYQCYYNDYLNISHRLWACLDFSINTIGLRRHFKRHIHNNGGIFQTNLTYEIRIKNRIKFRIKVQNFEDLRHKYSEILLLPVNRDRLMF